MRAGLRPLPGRFGRWLWAQVPMQTVLTGAALMLATRGSGLAAMDADEPGADPASEAP
ncbi:hypothetical protein ABXN37_08775 [Piscinibacter sakaiensis]|uniref:hypothetical protein n=1 Tax=Piscinibacter sakaiensis TaxID=1547922 RepID=UPI00372709A5